MALTLPEKVGEPRALNEKVFGKRMVMQKFNDRQGRGEFDYAIFEVSSKAAIVFPLTEKNEVIAIRQFRPAAYEILTEIPGGNAKGDQTLAQTARAELEEETGFRPAKLIQLTAKPIWWEPDSYKNAFYPFLALGCEKIGGQKLDETERIEVFEVPLGDWLKMILTGEVIDAKTIVTTALSLPHIKLSYGELMKLVPVLLARS